MGEEGNLVWTDDKVELLLDTVRDFKAEKEQQATNWELLKKGSLEIFLMERKTRNTHIV